MTIIDPSDFHQLTNKMIRINLAPPGFRKGRLIAIGNDYFVFLTEDNEYLFCQTSHLKCMTLSSFHEADSVSAIDNPISSYLNADSFRGVLEKMMFRRVQVDEGSHNGIEGIICNLFADHVDLVFEHEVIKVYISHIKAVRFAAANRSDSKKTNEQENKSEAKQEEVVEQTSSDTVSEVQNDEPGDAASQTSTNTESNKDYTGDSVQPQPQQPQSQSQPEPEPQSQPQPQPQIKKRKVRRLRKRRIKGVVIKKRKISMKKQRKIIAKVKNKQFHMNNTFKGMPKKKTVSIRRAGKKRSGIISYSVYTF